MLGFLNSRLLSSSSFPSEDFRFTLRHVLLAVVGVGFALEPVLAVVVIG
jgi:hypothetical protein